MRFPQKSDSVAQSYTQGTQHPWLWLAGFLKPKCTSVLVASIAVVAAAGSLLAIARGAQYLVDKSLADPTGGTLNLALLFMVGSAAIMAVASYFRSTTVNGLADYLGETIRAEVFDKILRLDAQFHSEHNSGDLVSRLGMEIGYIQNVVNVAIPNGVRNGLLLLGALGLMAFTSWHLSLLTVLAVPLLAIPVFFMAPRMRQYNRAVNEAIANKVSFLTERLGAIRTAQLFAAEDNMRIEMKASHAALHTAHERLFRMRGFLAAIIIVLVFSLIAFILWSGGRQVLEGTLTQGEVTAFVMYAIIAAGSLATLTELGQSLGQARAAIERLTAILQTETRVIVPATPKDVPDNVPEILFENVTFTYPNAAKPVLENINFTIQAHENVAIVGPSGAGKSTLFALLARLYDPQSGRVLLNGTDIKEFDPQALRRLFGVIPQEPDIFALSVADNIAFGLPATARELISASARQANIGDIIDAMEQGYDTVLGERGTGLSVGQKQRLAIARALVRNPKILLMDEATSALDAESERLVQQALQDAAKDRTAIIIAHRLATIRSAGRILVLEKGRLNAQGTHDELIKQGGLYAHLAGLQFLA